MTATTTKNNSNNYPKYLQKLQMITATTTKITAPATKNGSHNHKK